MQLKKILLTVGKNWQIGLFATVTVGIVAAIGTTFYLRGENLMEEQLKQRLREVAAISAREFSASDVQKIHGTGAMTKPVFISMVSRLNQLRKDVGSIRFAYIMRKTSDPYELEFVADADSLATDKELDKNGNGVVDETEQASYPGDIYDTRGAPALWGTAFAQPTVDNEVTVDQWGSLMSGYAPILDANGKPVAILGIDMDASDYFRLTQSIFSPSLFLLVFITALLFAGYICIYLWRHQLEILKRIDSERSGVMLLTSHQLGTPITMFQWALEGLRESFSKHTLDADLEKHLESMQTGVDRLKDILHSLRRASQVEQNQLLYKHDWTYIRDIVVEVVHQFSDELHRHSQKVTMDLDGNLYLPLDRTLITSVIQELLRNAMTFSAKNSTITITAKRVKDKAQVEVRDEGRGIPKADLSRMFGKFVRGANAYIADPHGGGLGLYIVHAIVQKAGGSIWIESKEGKGTSVFFTLPIDSSPRA